MSIIKIDSEFFFWKNCINSNWPNIRTNLWSWVHLHKRRRKDYFFNFSCMFLRCGICGSFFLSLSFSCSQVVIKNHQMKPFFAQKDVLGEKIIIWVKHGNVFTQIMMFSLIRLESERMRARGKRNTNSVPKLQLSFPIWILIVLIHFIWEISRNKLKKNFVTKNCFDLSLFEQIVLSSDLKIFAS